jgi:hypothetical protein
MTQVSASVALPVSVSEAEAFWYDTRSWSGWVDGLEQVIAIEGDWPSVGSEVIWVSGPAGRGRVTEHVLAYEQLRGQTLEVQDDSISGIQSVAFTPEDDGVEITLALEYRITQRKLLTPVVDMLFVRNAFSSSLRATLTRFAQALEPR